MSSRHRERTWHLETDASVRPGEWHKSGERPSVGGAGIVLWDPELRPVLLESILLGPVSCGPEAELCAVIAGLKIAKESGVGQVRLRTDCLGVVEHLTGERRLDTGWAVPLLPELEELARSFAHFEAPWSPSTHAPERRAGIPTADALARRAVGLGPRASRPIPRRLGGG